MKARSGSISRRLRVVALVAACAGSSLGASAQTQPQGAAKRPAAAPAKKPAGPAASASAAPVPANTSEYTTAPLDGGAPAPAYVPPPPRKPVPKPAPPSAEQVEALGRMQAEAQAWERDAKDFREAITRIVQQHYEDRRRRTLASLDGEIATEKSALREAREEAIKRLEEFVARYSVRKVPGDTTPDAMFRLAALYEERAREETPDDLGSTLVPAVALYKRILREYPQYRELAAVYYYLGHSLNDASRIEEAQQVWRSLVCHDKFPYPTPPDPKDPGKDTIVRLPQDHPREFWDSWANAHPTPQSLGKQAKKGTYDPKTNKLVPPPDFTGETAFVDPYPSDCTPVPQKVEEGADPKYLAEVWWQIGNYHFDQVDDFGGPYNLNRAVSSYRHSMQWKTPPVYEVSMYKLSWAYFKQQRYDAAVREFVALLDRADELEKQTGESQDDFRQEAYTYIAGALTYADFQGPGEREPFIPRNDVLDTESNPQIAEQKMRVAIDRVQDPKLIPQDRRWTFDVYRGLAAEFREISQLRNAIDVDELMLAKWPMHRDAPVVQVQIAELYDELTRLSRDGTPEREYNAGKALEARTKLAAYVGNMPWVDANRDDPEAIQTAEKLVKGGLRNAAATHTNLAKEYVAKATSSTDPVQQRTWLDRALAEYKLADVGWTGYLRQDENATDAYESRFWIADARHGAIVVAVALERSPSVQEYDQALQAAAEVRDSNEDDRYLQPAAQYAVDVVQQELTDQYRRFARSNGAQGIEERKEARFAGPDDKKQVVEDPVPVVVQQAMAVRDEYVERVAPSLDVGNNAPLYRYQVADYYFLYGHWADAKARFEPIWKEHCAKDEFGYKAWEKLITIAARSLDVEGSRALAKAEEEHSCAVTKEQIASASGIIKPVIQGGYYIDAARAFDEAGKMPDGPARVKKWREAAEKYENALKAAPERDEAPEAAINGALAWKQIGEYDRAIQMYELFIGKYGDEKTLAKLDADKSPKYAERVKYLKQAYDTLATSYVLFFNYRAAAETYDKIGGIQRFEEKDRREAARNALVLYSNMGDRERMTAMRSRLDKLSPTGEQKAEADFIVANSDMKGWDPHGSDDGPNRTARVRAIQAMTSFYDANKGAPAASQYVVEAAWNVARLHEAAGEKSADDWWRSTIQAFDKYKATAPVKDGRSAALGSREAGMAAQAEYTLIDEDIRKNWDYDAGHHRYAGDSDVVIKKYRDEAVTANKYKDRLQKVIDAYLSPEWAGTALARQGSVYDSLRTGLYNTRPPALQIIPKKVEAILKKFEASDNPDDQDKVDEIKQKYTEAWRTARERELNGADEAMVGLYAQSVVLSRKYNTRSPAINRAIQRLAFFTDILGEEKMKQYAAGIQGLDYREGMFLQTRPGLLASPKTQPMPGPAPVAP